MKALILLTLLLSACALAAVASPEVPDRLLFTSSGGCSGQTLEWRNPPAEYLIDKDGQVGTLSLTCDWGQALIPIYWSHDSHTEPLVVHYYADFGSYQVDRSCDGRGYVEYRLSKEGPAIHRNPDNERFLQWKIPCFQSWISGFWNG